MAGERVSHYRRGVSVVLYSMTLKDKGVVGFPRPVTPPKLLLLHPGDAAHGLPNPAPAQSRADIPTRSLCLGAEVSEGTDLSVTALILHMLGFKSGFSSLKCA